MNTANAKKAKIALIAAFSAIAAAIAIIIMIAIMTQDKNELQYVSAVAPTCAADGNTEFWYDNATGKYYSDSMGAVETTKEAVTLEKLPHIYGSWEVKTEPTSLKAGALVRTCQNDATHTEETVLPLLDEKNGYRLIYEWGELTGKQPTFTKSGSGFFVWKTGNQTFMFEERLLSLNSYYTRREDTTLFTVSDLTYTGASYDAAADTLVVDGSSSTVSLSVNAPHDGFYSLYLKYCTEGNKTTKVTVKNKSYTEWSGNNSATLGESSKNDTKTYLIPDYEVNTDFPKTPAVTVYLKKGENQLDISFSAKIGIGRLLFVEEKLFEGDTETVLLPYTGAASSANGILVHEGDSGESFSFTVPTDGSYTLYALLSTSGTRALLESTSNSFPTYTVDIPERQSGNSTANRQGSTYLYEIGTLSLRAGTHEARFALKETDNLLEEYLHYNMLILEKSGEPLCDSVTLDLTKKVNDTTHELDLSLSVSGNSPVGQPNMKVVISGYYTYTDGTETSFTEEFQKTEYNQSFAYKTAPLTGNMDGVTYAVSVYDESGTVLLEKLNRRHYSIRDTLTIFMMADLHYTGSNLTQYIRNFKYPETHNYAWNERALKSYDSYRTSYEAYGWTSDEKEMRIMDDILQRYAAGEFDILIFLGDQTMGDGNYFNFNPDHVVYPNQSHYGNDSMDDYWDHPLNTNYMFERLFLDRLSDAGVPYFCCHGNHEYLIQYNEDKTDISFEAWEDEYHYRELFGHKDADGVIYDASPNDYVVRVIRRDGEVKILSALSSSELRSFKNKHRGDGNCYDYYVSEDTLTDSDVMLGTLVVSATYQIDSYDNYMTYYTFARDPYTGEVDTTKKDSRGQTIRTDYLSKNILDNMDPMLADAENIYFFAHNYSDENNILSEFFAKYPQIQAMFMGDVHDETYTDYLGLVPKWVAGCFSCAYDVDFYYTYDENGNETGRDEQYYYYKNGRIGNSIGGDYRYHAFSYMMLHIKGNEAYAERERIGMFYDNYQPQYKLYGDRVIGWDPNYVRAVDYTHEAGESFKVGDRTVFVGGDVFTVGLTHLNIAKKYEKGAYNAPEYVLSPISGKDYTVCDLSGRPVTSGDTVVTLSGVSEGTVLTLNGQTYYIVSKSGGVVGHYLYDENGDFVYEDKNGNYVFYDFYKDENGDFIKEYFYEKEDGSFVPLGEWNADHTVYTLKDGTYTDMWLNGDPITIAVLDNHTNVDSFFEKVKVQLSVGKFKVDSGTIEIKNGIVLRGLGFMNFGYAYRFVDADGNEVSRSDVKVNQEKVYTFTLKDGVDPDSSPNISNFTVSELETVDGVGFYMPRMTYEKRWIDR